MVDLQRLKREAADLLAEDQELQPPTRVRTRTICVEQRNDPDVLDFIQRGGVVVIRRPNPDKSP